jgi:hypothetical protein
VTTKTFEVSAFFCRKITAVSFHSPDIQSLLLSIERSGNEVYLDENRNGKRHFLTASFLISLRYDPRGILATTSPNTCWSSLIEPNIQENGKIERNNFKESVVKRMSVIS